jgi:hypothetical protein
MTLPSIAGTEVATSPTINVSSTTYPYAVVRGKLGTASLWSFGIDYADATFTNSPTFTNTGFVTQTLPLVSGKTVVNIRINSLNGTTLVDYAYICGKTPLQLSADLANGTVTRVGTGGVDHCQLRLNNWKGKYITGVNAIGYGDHLHVYLGQGATPLHVYGGYVENLDPNLPNDMVDVQSRGFGVALLESLVLNQYTTSSPQTILNDVIDNFVNPANKNGLGIASNYQITRSYVQNIGSSIGVYISNMKNAHDVFKEITDLTTAQLTPAVFFVDPAENLHFVPLSASPNWTTDPFSATYATALKVGVNQITNRFRKDVTNLRNRVHYFGISQTPGIPDGVTDYSTDTAVTNNWGTTIPTGAPAGSAIALHSATTPIAIGTYDVNAHVSSTTIGVDALASWPKNGFSPVLDIGNMGSPASPPLFECYLRYHNTSGTPPIAPEIILRFGDASSPGTKFFPYNVLGAGTSYGSSNWIVTNPQQDYWYHVVFPIGPHGGAFWLNSPAYNGIPTATYTGTSAYQGTAQGITPSWNNIGRIDFEIADSAAGATYAGDWYIDGMRILAGRYYLAYDSRSVANGRYPDMREIHFFDPVSKDDTAIQNFAKAELLRLRNPVLRGGFHTPVLGDVIPEQQVTVTAPSANLSSSPLRCTQVVHRFSNRGMFTEFTVTDDFTNAQTVEPFKLINTILEMGDNAVFSRQLYDLKTALHDPLFVPTLIIVS